MPKISQGYPTIKITLPSYDGSELEIKTNISVEDLAESEKYEGLDHSAIILSRLLVKWNFQDENGKDLPINIDNIKKLPVADLTYIFSKVNPLLQKKTPSEKTS